MNAKQKLGLDHFLELRSPTPPSAPRPRAPSDRSQGTILFGDVWTGVGGRPSAVRVVSTRPTRLLGAANPRVAVVPADGQCVGIVLEWSTDAFHDAKLVSRLRPEPPPALTREMGWPDFAVCGCGRVARAQFGTAAPWSHRCPHGHLCSGRPLCNECLSAFDAVEGGGAAAGAADPEPFIYIVTYEGRRRAWSLVVVSRRAPAAIRDCASGWQDQIERHIGELDGHVELEQWRCGLPSPNE